MSQFLKKISTYSRNNIEFVTGMAVHNNVKAKLLNIMFWCLCLFAKLVLKYEKKYTYLIQRLRKHKQATPKQLKELRNSTYPWHKQLTEISRNKGNRILIIAELSISQCTKYRVKQKIEMLQHLGYEANYLSWRDFHACRNALQLHAIVIFYRTPAVPDVINLHKEAKRLNLTTIYEIDDLVFDVEEYSKNSNLKQLSQAEQHGLLDGAKLYNQLLCMCDHGIASTPTLANYMKKYCKGSVYIIENCLDSEILKLETARNLLLSNPAIITIGYGSGTTTHDLDFAVAADAVYDTLKTYPHVRFVIHGYLTLPDKFNAVSKQILRVPFLCEDDYFQSVAKFDISLAPLEPSIFNDAKSNIKYLEASLFKVPTVASPAAAFSQVIQPGKNGFTATTKEEWSQTLSKLIENPDLRQSIGQEAFRTVQASYHYQHVATAQVLPFISDQLPESHSQTTKVLMANVLFKPVSFGGATVVAEQLATELSENNGCHVTIFTGFFDTGEAPIQPEEVVRYETMGIPAIGIKFPDLITPTTDYRNDAIKDVFKDVLKTEQPDIVHLHSIQQLSASLAEACHEMNIPYIITCHDAWWLCEKQFMVNSQGVFCNQTPIDLRVCASTCTPSSSYTYERARYLKRQLDNATLILTPSQHHCRLYIDNGFSPEKVRVNENGVLPPAAQKKTDAASLKTVRFAYLGGKADHKGYRFIKSVFESVKPSNYELHIADIHRKTGLPRIFQRDWSLNGKLIIDEGFDQSTIDNYFANIDVLLLPSQCQESFGLTIREALIRDCWVITTNCGGPVEAVLEGKNGNIIDMHDHSAFQSAIEAVLEKPSRYNSFVNPTKDQIKTFRDQASELVTYFNDILAK